MTLVSRVQNVPAMTLLCLCVVTLLSTPNLHAKQTITITKSGSQHWQDMVEAEKNITRKSQTVLDVPFMPVLFNSTLPLPLGTQSGPTASTALSVVPPPVGASSLGPVFATSFAAIGDNNSSIPPDTMGAAGPSHLMTMLNTQVRIQNKTGGTISTVSLSTFWTSGTGITGTPFDPLMVYDSIDDRWIATCDANSRSANSEVFFAISATSDPTGSWDFYEFEGDTNDVDWADFPGLGVNTNWIAITENMFTVSGGTFTGAKMWVIDKSTALAGGPLTMTVFETGFDVAGGITSSTLKPCRTFGDEQKLYVMDGSGFTSGGTQLLRMSEITGTPANPSWSATSGSVFGTHGLFFVDTNFDGSQLDAPQLGTAALVKTNDRRMQNPVFRNGKIWCTHSAGLPVGAVDRTAVFWYELDPAAMASTGAPIVQSGVLDGGAGVHHIFPSIGVNANDDACIGFSRADATRFVEAVATTRGASDPAGTMDPITLLKAGEDSYIKDFGGSRIRWGDYSATVVDPADDMTFWTLQEYAETDVGSGASDDRWGMWWGKFVVAGSSNTLAVTSPYGTASPSTGVHTFATGTSLTGIMLTSPVVTDDGSTMLTAVCTGWVGTGSVPVSGTGTNTGAFTLSADSSLTWLWDITDLYLSNTVENASISHEASATITAGESYIIQSPGDVSLKAGTQVRFTPGFEARSGSELKAEIEP
jgi:hypothetical protein